MIIKFPIGHQLDGFGFDTISSDVISFKQRSSGTVLLPLRSASDTEVNDDYCLNGIMFKRLDVARLAQQLQQTPQATSTPHKSTINGVLSFPYVMYSVKHQRSQYFFANTPIADALALFARGGRIIAAEDVRFINALTGKSVAFQIINTPTFVFE